MNRILFGFLFISYIFVVFAKSDNDVSLEKPLILTTYIENGRIDEAKEKAYVRLPQMKNIESYAGYLTINKTYNSNTFFWYFPSQSCYTPGSSLLKNMTGFDFPYNYLQTKQPAEINRYIDWLTKPDVRKALHIGNAKFNASASIVKKYFMQDFHKSSAHLVEDLLEDYQDCGQLDIICACVGTEKAIAAFNWTGAEDYSEATKKLWRVNGEVAGYSKTGKILNYVMVRNAGHYFCRMNNPCRHGV